MPMKRASVNILTFWAQSRLRICRFITLWQTLFLHPLAKSDDIGLTIPRKVTSYMAGGKPVLTCMDGEGSLVIQKAKAGLTALAGDSRTLYENKKLKAMPRREREQLGGKCPQLSLCKPQPKKSFGQLIDFILN